MARTASILIQLGSTRTGLALKAQLEDTAGAAVGSEITAGFSEKENGNYLWTYDGFPDAFRGSVRFYTGAAPGTHQADVAINPEDLEPASSGTGTGEGEILVNHTTLDDDDDTMVIVDADENGIDGVHIVAYVESAYAADPTAATPQAETYSLANGHWRDALGLDAGVQYRIRPTKTGHTFEDTTVTPEAP